jgi:hypothetical protein
VNNTHKQTDLSNAQMKNYAFLECMYEDKYFPPQLVDKCKGVLVDLCFRIEKEQPQSVEALYALSHEATNGINALQEEFFAQGSEIETAAAECLAMDFLAIASAYGFEADVEMLIATREW